MSEKNLNTEEPFKIKLARALDDNLHTRQWHIYLAHRYHSSLPNLKSRQSATTAAIATC